MDDKLIKEAFKEAITEWMDEKFQTFGKWSLTAIGVAALGALAYLIFVSLGWKPPA